MRRAELAARDDLGRPLEHGRPPQHEPHLMRHLSRAAPRHAWRRPDPARAASRRTRGDPASTASSTASRCAAVQVHTHTTSTPATSSSERRRRLRRRDDARPGPRGRVGVVGERERRVDELRVGELLQHVRVHGADVPAAHEPDPHHGLLPRAVRRATPDRPNASRSDRGPRRRRARLRRDARRARRPATRHRRVQGHPAHRRRRGAATTRHRADAHRVSTRRRRATRARWPGTTVLTSVAAGSVLRAGPRLEVAVADLQRDRARLEVGVAQARGHAIRQAHQLAVALGLRVEIDGERLFRPDRLRFVFRHHCARVVVAREREQPAPQRIAERSNERRLGQLGDLTDRVHAHAFEALQRRRADAPQARNGETARGKRARYPAQPR